MHANGIKVGKISSLLRRETIVYVRLGCLLKSSVESSTETRINFVQVALGRSPPTGMRGMCSFVVLYALLGSEFLSEGEGLCHGLRPATRYRSFVTFSEINEVYEVL